MVDFGAFSYGAAIGWLSILFMVPPFPLNWRPLAFAAVLWFGCILLSWWYAGISGVLAVVPGLVAGMLTAISFGSVRSWEVSK
jgi:hypothetical protein